MSVAPPVGGAKAVVSALCVAFTVIASGKPHDAIDGHLPAKEGKMPLSVSSSACCTSAVT